MAVANFNLGSRDEARQCAERVAGDEQFAERARISEAPAVGLVGRTFRSASPPTRKVGLRPRCPSPPPFAHARPAGGALHHARRRGRERSMTQQVSRLRPCRPTSPTGTAAIRSSCCAFRTISTRSGSPCATCSTTTRATR
jgi:hypothetical protein